MKIIMQPELKLYIRRKDEPRLPYAIGEFYFAGLIFSFIVPFCSLDTSNFCNKDSFDYLNEIFKFDPKTELWREQDFSNNSKLPFSFNLTFKQEELS